jgi:2-polyprenyl-3-methyl-5-hydroxy-6-metoxy-1,4-benzoquinol methylase
MKQARIDDAFHARFFFGFNNIVAQQPLGRPGVAVLPMWNNSWAALKKSLLKYLLGSYPYDAHNERDTCVCGTARRDIPRHLWRVTDKDADLIFPQFYYKCPSCSSFSAVNLYFPAEKYHEMPLDAIHISEVKLQLNGERLSWMKQIVTFPEDPVVFDLGAGEGCFAHVFADAYPSAGVYAVEADARLENKFYSQKKNVFFVPMYIERFLQDVMKPHSAWPRPFLIVMTDVLEHVLAPEQLLERIAQTLVPGGYAYLTIPDADTFQAPLPYPVAPRSINWAQANRTCQHLWAIQPGIFRDLVSKFFMILAASQQLETNIRKDSVYSTILAQSK